MTVVDTSVWIDFFNGITTLEVDWLDRHLTRRRLGILDLMLCEVLQGLDTEADVAAVTRELGRLEVFDTGGIPLATAAARNHRILRRKGRTVRKTIDCLIATFCMERNHALLHSDADFDPFAEHLGLRVIQA